MFTLIDSSGSDPKDWPGNGKRLHSLIRLVPDPKDWSGNGKRLHSLIALVSDPKDSLGNEKRLHSLIPLVLTLRIGRVMGIVYTH